jgi:hypothetical protein
MPLFTTSQQFIDAFGDYQAEGFYDPVILNDTSVGFSIKRDYPIDIRYKPAIGQNTKTPDNIAVIWAVYTSPELTGAIVDLSKAPIRLRIALMSKYRTKHWDYNFDDQQGDCPTKESLEASLATPQPIELFYENEYFYNHHKNSFIDNDGNLLSGSEVLNQVFQGHCDTVHLLKGLSLRLKLAWQSKFPGLLTLIIDLLTVILKQIFGRTIESSAVMAGIYLPYKRESFKKLDEDSIDILGYKASKHVVVIFCIVVIATSAYRYYNSIDYDYISSLEGKELLTLTHGILLLWLIDTIIPWVIFYTINLVLYFKKKIMFMRFSAS